MKGGRVMHTYAFEASHVLCRLRHRGLCILDMVAEARAQGILQAHLLHYGRQRGSPSQAARNIVCDLASATGIDIHSRHEADLIDFLREYLSALFCHVPKDSELFWDVCGQDYLAPLPFYRLPIADALNADWHGRRVWLNPRDHDDLAAWVAKAAKCEAELCICFLPVKPGEPWFREHVVNHPTAEIRIVPRTIAIDLQHGNASQRRILAIYRRPKG